MLVKACECAWAQPELPYLGHVVGRDSVKTNPAKIQSVVDLPQTVTVEDVQQFLGLTRFSRQNVQAYASSAIPLMR